MEHPQRDYDIDVSEWCWDWIEQFKKYPDAAKDQFRIMSRKDLKRFYRECEEAIEELIPYQRDEEKGLDGEDLHELAAWVVSRGRDYYRRVWHDLSLIPSDLESVDLCNYAAAAASVYQERFAEELF